ncbi:MAG: hypothetical protein EOO56_09695 [Hymenobacter sp.]|nr:MAG: hypothetical protein EOO56_09695 [Hymenobacter sp.]
MKLQKLALLGLGALASAGGFSSCKQDPFVGIKSHERAITAFTLDKGQIGVADITRTTGDTSKVTVYVVQGTSLAQVTPTIATSYKASVSPGSGSITNFAATKGKATYTVTSESGESRIWLVQIKDYQSDLDGVWHVNQLKFQYFIGEGQSWGWNGTKNLADNMPNASKEMDNTITFTVTGVTATGNLTGTFTHNAGPDGLFGDFKQADGTDFNYKFRKLPKTSGTFLRNFTDNTLTFNPGTNESKTIPLVFNATKSMMQVSFNVQPYDIDWNGSGGKMELGGAKFAWYLLQK